MKGCRRKNISAGNTTTYKLPAIKGEEGKAFYTWLNSAKSINGLITEALKLKFMMDQLKMHNSKDATLEKEKVFVQVVKSKEKEIPEAEDINIIDESDVDIDMLTKTLGSVKR